MPTALNASGVALRDGRGRISARYSSRCRENWEDEEQEGEDSGEASENVY